LKSASGDTHIKTALLIIQKGGELDSGGVKRINGRTYETLQLRGTKERVNSLSCTWGGKRNQRKGQGTHSYFFSLNEGGGFALEKASFGQQAF